jgi:photosystem II stability/assembly factor-like uncharacterized protein
MKTTNFLLATVFCFLTIGLNAQWEWQNPVPQGNTLNDVFFINQDIGWAVGELGTILKTTNGGATFEMQSSNLFERLHAVEFFTPQHGFAVGANGTILETNNGGDAWNTVSSCINADLLDLCLVEPGKIWIGGENGTLILSIDGGYSWESKWEDSAATIRSIFFLDGDHGWAAGGNGMYHSLVLFTEDGGETWVTITENVFAEFSEIQFTDQLTGWAVAVDGNVYKTEDNGTTWIQQLEPPPGVDGPDYKNICFPDPDHGWAVGISTGCVPLNHAVVMQTSDGGGIWQSQSPGVGYGGGLNSVFFTDSLHGCAVGSEGNITLTSNGGYEWDPVCSNQILFLLDVFFTDSQHGWVAGGYSYPFRSELSQTSDGGNTWSLLDVPFHYYKAIHFTDPSEGWVAGGGFYSAGFDDNVVIHTTDGGANWEIQYQEDGSHDFYTFKDICFVNAERGWVVGGSLNVNPPQNPIFLQTTDGGETWEDLSGLTGNCLNAITFSDVEHGWIAGHETIMQTIDGGESWTEIWQGVHSIKDIFFFDPDHGWAIGDSIFGWGYPDVVMRTTNGGVTWDMQYFDLELNKIWFTDMNTGLITIGNGILLQTQDGGITWEEQLIPAEASLNGIFFLDQQQGWIVGSNASIMHTDNGGLVGVKERPRTVQSSTLYLQNYPNPFHSSITIEFELKAKTQATLEVYNHMGQQVAELLNESRAKGQHQLTWNATYLPPGLYFLRLQAGNDVRIGKVIKY